MPPGGKPWFGEEHAYLFVDRPAVWVMATIDYVDGYKESGDRTHHALTPLSWPSMPFFVEGSDGWHYGIFQASGKWNQLRRFKVSRDAVEDDALLGSLPSGLVADVINVQNPVFLGPDGSVYVRVRTDGLISETMKGEPWGKKVVKWSGSSFVDAGDFPLAHTVWWRFQSDDLGCGPYCEPESQPAYNYKSIQVVEDTYRRMVPVVLKSGRWVAPDTIPGDGTISHLGRETTCPSVSCMREAGGCDDMCGGSPCHPATPCPTWPGTDWTTVTTRVTGDAWWERDGDGVPWSGVAGTGTSQRNSSRANQYDVSFADLYQAPAITAPSAWALARKDQAATERLPTIRFAMTLESCGTPDVQTPWQGNPLVEVDDAFLYYYLLGARDKDNVFRAGGLYKGSIPGAGAYPTWTKLFDEPDISVGQVIGMAVSDGRLWVIDEANVLAHYAKDGTDRKEIVLTSPNRLTTAWAHRWR